MFGADGTHTVEGVENNIVSIFKIPENDSYKNNQKNCSIRQP